MKARLLVALAAGLTVGSNPAPDMGEVMQLQVIPPGSRWLGADGSVWDFKKDGELRIKDAHGVESLPSRYRIDPKASPSRLDMPYDGGLTYKAIFRVEGDRLVLCCSLKDHPTRFMTGANCGTYLLSLKRLK